MTKFVHRIRRALAQDSETVPLDGFTAISATVQVHGPKRLDALGEVLEERRDRAAAQVYLRELISKAQRQVGGEQSLFKTFAARVAEIPESTLDALPERTRRALTRLGELTTKQPIPVVDPLLFAHGLTIDGEFCRLVGELSGEPVKPKETPATVFRRLSSKHHPDKGGSAETQAALNELWQSVRRSDAR